MKGVNKSFDIDSKFKEIEKIFQTFEEDGHRGEYKGMAINIVKDLIDILRTDPERSDNNISNKVCKFVDKINLDRDGTLWDLSRGNYDGEPLMTFLNELAVGNKFTSQINRIFMSV